MFPELQKKPSENMKGSSESRIPASNVENILEREKGSTSVKKVR